MVRDEGDDGRKEKTIKVLRMDDKSIEHHPSNGSHTSHIVSDA